MRVELRLLAMTAGAIAPALLTMSAPSGAADEAFTATKAISAPSGTINSFDISFVDPVLGLYLPDNLIVTEPFFPEVKDNMVELFPL